MSDAWLQAACVRLDHENALLKLRIQAYQSVVERYEVRLTHQDVLLAELQAIWREPAVPFAAPEGQPVRVYPELPAAGFAP